MDSGVNKKRVDFRKERIWEIRTGARLLAFRKKWSPSIQSAATSSRLEILTEASRIFAFDVSQSSLLSITICERRSSTKFSIGIWGQTSKTGCWSCRNGKNGGNLANSVVWPKVRLVSFPQYLSKLHQSGITGCVLKFFIGNWGKICKTGCWSCRNWKNGWKFVQFSGLT